MPKETPEQYAKRMASDAYQSARLLFKTIEDLEASLEKAKDELRSVQRKCPHLRLEHHPRRIAEDDIWDECLDCGARL